MFNFIASSFFQKKHCQLPGIGSLSLVKRPAQTDFVNGQIKAPIEEILFTPAKNSRPVFNEFSAISELMIKKMDEEGEVALAGIGIFVKKETGLINFFPRQLDSAYYPAVSARRVIRQDAQHSILVGDKETTNTEMNEYYSEEDVVKDRWWVWAIVLGLAGIGLLAIYLYNNGFNSLSNIALPSD